MRMKGNGLAKWTAALFVLLLVNTAYIAAFASPTIFYMGNVLAHLVLGVVLAVAFGVLLARRPDLRPGIVPAAVLFLIALLAGLWLSVAGNVLAHRPVLWAHVAAAGLGVIALGHLALAATDGSARLARAGRGSGRRSRSRPCCWWPCRPRRALAQGEPQPQRPHRQPAGRPRLHAGGGRRAEVAVLPLVGEDQRRRHHPVELLHGFEGAAASATRTSTSSGRARCTTSPRSTTSSTASRSSTCRTSSAPSRASGAPAATITRSSSTAASTSRSRSRSTRRKRRPASPARPATPSRTSTARWATATSPSSIRRCTNWRPARTRCIRTIDHFLTYLNPEPHRSTFMKPFMREHRRSSARPATRCTSTCR